MKDEIKTPSLNPKVALSDCCNSDVITNNLTIFQMVNHDFKTYCSHCDKECFYTWNPVYKMVSKGTYRKIVYNTLIQPNEK